MFLRPLIHLLPPETAHALGIFALRHGLLPGAFGKPDPALHVQTLGLEFTSPLGLAAGFDKNGVAVNGLLKQGFGFVESGTVTPLAQPGNPRPRLFRLKEDEAVINRLGFNNDGLDAFVKFFSRRKPELGIAGVNIGKNKDSADAVADYVRGVRTVYPVADYITVNISSPNTEGLRDLQKGDALTKLLLALNAARAGSTRHVPLLLKIAPDLEIDEREEIARAALDFGLDGIIVSNTTISRPADLKSKYKEEKGGLSGRPLFDLSTQALKHFYRLTGGQMVLIGAGGISSPEDAYEKIRAGATLVQLYTALVYQGFGLVREINRNLPKLLARDGFMNVQQAVGADVR